MKLSNIVSIVILTFNRRNRVKKHLEYISKFLKANLEIIIVDNGSVESVADLIFLDSRAFLIDNGLNLGAVGRNHGMNAACGDIIITFDDDVYGITDEHLEKIETIFKDDTIAAVNFRIREEKTFRIINWCHPCDVEKYYNLEFETNEISEGAVAFRRSALEKVGLYPEYFFISHEGPDLALRFINAGFRVIYSPEIEVIHAYDQGSRASWRRYYFDTRNQLWLVLRNLSGWYAVRRLIIGWGSMFVYSVRDGFLRYWLRAVWDSIKGIPRAWRDRQPPNANARRKWREIERNKPGFWKMVKARLFKRHVRI